MEDARHFTHTFLYYNDCLIRRYSLRGCLFPQHRFISSANFGASGNPSSRQFFTISFFNPILHFIVIGSIGKWQCSLAISKSTIPNAQISEVFCDLMDYCVLQIILGLFQLIVPPPRASLDPSCVDELLQHDYDFR